MPSTVIKNVAYNEDDRTLKITFQTDVVYVYYDVPPSVHMGLTAARSKGGYFNRMIVGRFPFKRL